jgi:hypothetical protein
VYEAESIAATAVTVKSHATLEASSDVKGGDVDEAKLANRSIRGIMAGVFVAAVFVIALFVMVEKMKNNTAIAPAMIVPEIEIADPTNHIASPPSPMAQRINSPVGTLSITPTTPATRTPKITETVVDSAVNSFNSRGTGAIGVGAGDAGVAGGGRPPQSDAEYARMLQAEEDSQYNQQQHQNQSQRGVAGGSGFDERNQPSRPPPVYSEHEHAPVIKGMCSVCGKPVYDTQERNQNPNSGMYYHTNPEQCSGSAAMF